MDVNRSTTAMGALLYKRTSSDFAGVGQSYFDGGDGDDVRSDTQADKLVVADIFVLENESALVAESALVDKLTDESAPADESALMAKSARLDAIRQALKKSDAFSLIKPRLDQLAGLAGKDPSMVIEIQDTLVELEISLLHWIAAKQPSAGVQTGGIVTLPATDAAKQSKHIPAGNATQRKGKNKKKQRNKQEEEEEEEEEEATIVHNSINNI
jgi:hypothetical protein